MALASRSPARVPPAAWCALLLRRCGLTFRDTQVPTVLGALQAQLQARGHTHERAYYEQLVAAPDGDPAWTALVEPLLNHETSFFRHPRSFDVLRTHLLPALRAARGAGSCLQVWSAGCATGQEAYSLAMVARDAADRDGAFRVWGGDLSREAIAIARQGRYGPRAVAGVPAPYRARFLRRVGAGPEWEIVDALRQHVRFSAVNLLAADSASLSYDVIVCHNVLIYLAPPAVAQVVARLAARLTRGGYLLLGPGEGPTEPPAGLEAVTCDGLRLWRRAGPGPAGGRAA